MSWRSGFPHWGNGFPQWAPVRWGDGGHRPVGAAGASHGSRVQSLHRRAAVSYPDHRGGARVLGSAGLRSKLVLPHACCRVALGLGLIFIRVSLIRKPRRPRKIKQLFGAKNAWRTLIRAQVNRAPGEEKWRGFFRAAGLAAGRRGSAVPSMPCFSVCLFHFPSSNSAL